MIPPNRMDSLGHEDDEESIRNASEPGWFDTQAHVSPHAEATIFAALTAQDALPDGFVAETEVGEDGKVKSVIVKDDAGKTIFDGSNQQCKFTVPVNPDVMKLFKEGLGNEVLEIKRCSSFKALSNFVLGLQTPPEITKVHIPDAIKEQLLPNPPAPRPTNAAEISLFFAKYGATAKDLADSRNDTEVVSASSRRNEPV